MNLSQSFILLVLGHTIIAQQLEGLISPVNYPGISDSCSQALNTTVANCPAFLRGIALDNPRLTSDQLSYLCTSDCHTSLINVRKTIADGCNAKSDVIFFEGIDWPGMYPVLCNSHWAIYSNILCSYAYH